MYIPFLLKAESWENVVEFYAGFASNSPRYEPMHVLVSQIAESNYSTGLFACTSMFELLISQASEFERGREVLSVLFNGATQQFHFEYWEHPTNDKRWLRECDALEGYATFERFLQLKKWFN